MPSPSVAQTDMKQQPANLPPAILSLQHRQTTPPTTGDTAAPDPEKEHYDIALYGCNNNRVYKVIREPGNTKKETFDLIFCVGDDLVSQPSSTEYKIPPPKR